MPDCALTNPLTIEPVIGLIGVSVLLKRSKKEWDDDDGRYRKIGLIALGAGLMVWLIIGLLVWAKLSGM